MMEFEKKKCYNKIVKKKVLYKMLEQSMNNHLGWSTLSYLQRPSQATSKIIIFFLKFYNFITAFTLTHFLTFFSLKLYKNLSLNL